MRQPDTSAVKSSRPAPSPRIPVRHIRRALTPREERLRIAYAPQPTAAKRPQQSRPSSCSPHRKHVKESGGHHGGRCSESPERQQQEQERWTKAILEIFSRPGFMTMGANNTAKVVMPGAAAQDTAASKPYNTSQQAPAAVLPTQPHHQASSGDAARSPKSAKAAMRRHTVSVCLPYSPAEMHSGAPLAQAHEAITCGGSDNTTGSDCSLRNDELQPGDTSRCAPAPRSEATERRGSDVVSHAQHTETADVDPLHSAAAYGDCAAVVKCNEKSVRTVAYSSGASGGRAPRDERETVVKRLRRISMGKGTSVEYDEDFDEGGGADPQLQHSQLQQVGSRGSSVSSAAASAGAAAAAAGPAQEDDLSGGTGGRHEAAAGRAEAMRSNLSEQDCDAHERGEQPTSAAAADARNAPAPVLSPAIAATGSSAQLTAVPPNSADNPAARRPGSAARRWHATGNEAAPAPPPPLLLLSDDAAADAHSAKPVVGEGGDSDYELDFDRAPESPEPQDLLSGVTEQSQRDGGGGVGGAGAPHSSSVSDAVAATLDLQRRGTDLRFNALLNSQGDGTSAKSEQLQALDLQVDAAAALVAASVVVEDVPAVGGEYMSGEFDGGDQGGEGSVWDDDESSIAVAAGHDVGTEVQHTEQDMLEVGVRHQSSGMVTEAQGDESCGVYESDFE
ncbi:hypothetical protein JKP88DRAFT_249541 [Tribonema minus]|uniref:Uncharacterized protein n=1 Tax=Tribonema minus TaxID=303371 RepID=A0A835YTI5_9STRA|nr:hypothetical protein JKP88DRAFT_249541 [Tribonema minus]